MNIYKPFIIAFASILFFSKICHADVGKYLILRNQYTVGTEENPIYQSPVRDGPNEIRPFSNGIIYSTSSEIIYAEGVNRTVLKSNLTNPGSVYVFGSKYAFVDANKIYIGSATEAPTVVYTHLDSSNNPLNVIRVFFVSDSLSHLFFTAFDTFGSASTTSLYRYNLTGSILTTISVGTTSTVFYDPSLAISEQSKYVLKSISVNSSFGSAGQLFALGASGNASELGSYDVCNLSNFRPISNLRDNVNYFYCDGNLLQFYVDGSGTGQKTIITGATADIINNLLSFYDAVILKSFKNLGNPYPGNTERKLIRDPNHNAYLGIYLQPSDSTLKLVRINDDLTTQIIADVSHILPSAHYFSSEIFTKNIKGDIFIYTYPSLQVGTPKLLRLESNDSLTDIGQLITDSSSPFSKYSGYFYSELSPNNTITLSGLYSYTTTPCSDLSCNAFISPEALYTNKLALDLCPASAQDFDPGQCGCDQLEKDSDADGVSDCIDTCNFDPAKTLPGVCGCLSKDIDTDLDGKLDCQDICPNDKAKIVPGSCGCGKVDGQDANKNGVDDCLTNKETENYIKNYLKALSRDNNKVSLLKRLSNYFKANIDSFSFKDESFDLLSEMRKALKAAKKGDTGAAQRLLKKINKQVV